jgi:hypothetical protein
MLTATLLVLLSISLAAGVHAFAEGERSMRKSIRHPADGLLPVSA